MRRTDTRFCPRVIIPVLGKVQRQATMGTMPRKMSNNTCIGKVQHKHGNERMQKLQSNNTCIGKVQRGRSRSLGEPLYVIIPV